MSAALVGAMASATQQSHARNRTIRDRRLRRVWGARFAGWTCANVYDCTAEQEHNKHVLDTDTRHTNYGDTKAFSKASLTLLAQ